MLYKYVFRGIGIVFVAGMLTALFTAINSQMHDQGRNSSPTVHQSPEKGKVRR